MLSPEAWSQARAAAPLVGQYAALFSLAYFALVVGYRIFFHRLRTYPGPGWARVSDAYSLYFGFQKKLHLQTYQNLKKYGPVIRQGPNKLVFNSVAAVQDIYQNNEFTKSACYHAMVTMPPTTSVFEAIDKSVHRIKRQRIAPILSPKNMRTFEPQMQEQIDILLRKLLEICQKTPGVSIDMKKKLKGLTLNIVTLLAFGYDLQLQTSTKHWFLVDAMERSNWRYGIYFNVPWIKSQLLEISILLFDWLLKDQNVFSMILKIIRHRTSEEKHARQDLYSFMMKQLDAVDSTEKLSVQEIWSEAIFFIVAGSDTSSSTMSSLLFYLSRNPECKEKLLRELQATFKSGRDIRAGTELSSCVYLRACIDEAMRMSPAVPGVLWRQRSTGGETKATGSEPWIVDGHVIPPGTQVGVNAYSMHHNEEYFPDPFTYKPERWLPVEGGDDAAPSQANRAAFIPFSIGDRSCAGKAMAFQGISLTITKTLWYFDFELAPESQTEGTEFVLQDTFVGSHEGPHMHFYPREELWKDLVPESQ